MPNTPVPAAAPGLLSSKSCENFTRLDVSDRAPVRTETVPASSRRGFLRGLTTLPLIGGGVTLIGAPSAVAEPVTRDLLETYDAWLHFERCSLKAEYEGGCRLQDVEVWTRRPDGSAYAYLPLCNPGACFHALEAHRSATERAALVLATVGCEWRAGR